MRFNVMVRNVRTNRVDFHMNLTREEVSYISSSPNLYVEILSEDFDVTTLSE
jgi:hypothetical protein